MLKFACIITGDDYQMLMSDTPASRKKVNTLVSVMFLPVLMWAINVALLMSCVLNNSIISTIIGTLLAGTVIFIIERSIIMANGSRVVMVFRIILGFLIATMGSIAFDEVIFSEDIDQQLAEKRGNELFEAEKRVDSLFSNQIQLKEAEVKGKHMVWLNSQDRASSEADGTSGSGARGVNSITRLKMEIANENNQDYLKTKTELSTLKNNKESDKQIAIKKVEASFSDHALLSRIEALFDLVLSNKYMFAVYIIFTLILFVLEFMVVILKLSLPQSNYERKLDMIEKIGERRLKMMQQKDPEFFDNAMHYPKFNQTKRDLRQFSARSLFN
jgi:hypothetical protein